MEKPPRRTKRGRQSKVETKVPMEITEGSKSDTGVFEKKSKIQNTVPMVTTTTTITPSSIKKEAGKKVLRKITVFLVNDPTNGTFLIRDIARLRELPNKVDRLPVSHADGELVRGIFCRAYDYPTRPNTGDVNEAESKIDIVVETNTFQPRLFYIPQHDAPIYLPEKQQGFLCCAIDKQEARVKLGKRMMDLKSNSTMQYHERKYDVQEIFPTDFGSDGVKHLA